MRVHTIYGPPGTGKTNELLNRLETVKQRYGPKSIGFLSFTKAGAAEALKRLNIQRSNNVCTIHSLAFRLNGCSRASVVDDAKLARFGEKIGLRFRGAVDPDQIEIGDQYMSILSRARNRMVSPRDEYFESDRPGDWAEFKFFCESYSAWKKAGGLTDFNDMIADYVRNPVSAHMSVLFIDEAQDLSNLQWEMINGVIRLGGISEVHVAGDDDQAIFEWSGANAHGMLKFEEQHKSDRVILDKSWRVPANVHKIATKVAKTIGHRVAKQYRPRDANGTVRRVSWLDHKTLVHGQDTMILCRSYVSQREVEEELTRARIPHKNEGGMPGLFSNRIAGAIRAIKKLQGGQTISQLELDRITASATSRVKEEIKNKNFTSLLKKKPVHSLVVPPTLVEFYTDAEDALVDEPTIRVSTIHRAKGREADKVVLHTGITNRIANDMLANPDSESRVWYVAVTRSKDTLEILEAENGYSI